MQGIYDHLCIALCKYSPKATPTFYVARRDSRGSALRATGPAALAHSEARHTRPCAVRRSRMDSVIRTTSAPHPLLLIPLSWVGERCDNPQTHKYPLTVKDAPRNSPQFTSSFSRVAQLHMTTGSPTHPSDVKDAG